MSESLKLMIGKICFSLSFLDKEIEEEVKESFYISETSQKQNYLVKIGHQDNRNIYKDWEVSYFKGERWYYNMTKKGEIHILFPNNGTFTHAVRILAFLYGKFYQFGRVNGKRSNDFLIHAAGLKRHGTGFLFTGPSGAGKTTISKLSLPEAEVLSDETIVVTEDHGEYLISQGVIKTEVSEMNVKLANLGAVFILVQDRVNSLRRLSGTETVLKLMDNIIFVKLSSGLRYLDIVAEKLRFISSMCSSVPVYELRFTKDKSFWREIERSGLFKSFGK